MNETMADVFKKVDWPRLLLAFLVIAPIAFVISKTRSAPAPISISVSPPKSDYENTPIHVSRISLIDCYGRKTSGWQITRFDRPLQLKDPPARPWDAYDSLYSPDLRSVIAQLPKGTRIGLERSPAEPVFSPQRGPRYHIPTDNELSPEERELKDFSNFCRALSLDFFNMPVS